MYWWYKYTRILFSVKKHERKKQVNSFNYTFCLSSDYIIFNSHFMLQISKENLWRYSSIFQEPTCHFPYPFIFLRNDWQIINQVKNKESSMKLKKSQIILPSSILIHNYEWNFKLYCYFYSLCLFIRGANNSGIFDKQGSAQLFFFSIFDFMSVSGKIPSNLQWLAIRRLRIRALRSTLCQDEIEYLEECSYSHLIKGNSSLKSISVRDSAGWSP